MSSNSYAADLLIMVKVVQITDRKADIILQIVLHIKFGQQFVYIYIYVCVFTTTYKCNTFIMIARVICHTTRENPAFSF